jgi:hypothetical protein
MAALSLGGSKSVVTRPQETTTLTGVTIVRLVDRPSDKVVNAFTEEFPNPIALWTDADYDSIGDWTQAQAEARLVSLINAM